MVEVMGWELQARNAWETSKRQKLAPNHPKLYLNMENDVIFCVP